MRKVNLFCLSYAGGSAKIYEKLKDHLCESIGLHLLELPGRGIRYDEPLCESIDDMVNDSYSLISRRLDGFPFAIFGYSMGSLIAYELAHKFRQNQKLVHIFLCAREAPHICYKNKTKLSELSYNDFKNEIASLGGTPKRLLENSEMYTFFAPILRADYKAWENYTFSKKTSKIACDISVLYGKNDNSISITNMEEWQKNTTGQCNIYQFDGDHFFIFSNWKNIANMINRVLFPQFLDSLE